LDLSQLAGLRIPEPLQIAQLLSKRSQIFSDKTEAVEFSAAQPRRWGPVLRLLSDQSTRQIFEKLEQNVGQADFLVLDPPDGTDIAKGDGGFKVTGSIPLLSENDVAVLELFAKQHFSLVAAAVIVECRSISASIKVTTLSLDIFSEMLIYASGGMTTTDVAGRLWNFQETVDQTQVHANETSKQLKNDFTQFVSDEREKLSAFKQSLSEEVKLRSASSLWSGRARWHRFVAVISLTAFIGILCAALWYIGTQFKQIVDLLPRDKDSHIEYVSVALLAIPAIGIGWGLKVLARFIQNNSILGDDSRQRQAMTRTYLALVADKDSGVTEKDRLVMLNAIFRPLPGTQVDEVAPPTILDLMKREH
jgi:hypothetical protein